MNQEELNYLNDCYNTLDQAKMLLTKVSGEQAFLLMRQIQSVQVQVEMLIGNDLNG